MIKKALLSAGQKLPQRPLGHHQPAWMDRSTPFKRQHGQPDRQHRRPYPLHRRHRRNCQNRHPVLGKRPLSAAPPSDLNGDGEITFLDTYIYLFRDDGSLDSSDYIAHNDDSATTPTATARSGAPTQPPRAEPGRRQLPAGDRRLRAERERERERERSASTRRCSARTRTPSTRSVATSPAPTACRARRPPEHGAYRVNFSQNVSVSGKDPGARALGLGRPRPASLALWRPQEALTPGQTGERQRRLRSPFFMGWLPERAIRPRRRPNAIALPAALKARHQPGSQCRQALLNPCLCSDRLEAGQASAMA